MAINRSFWILNGQKYHAKRKMAKNQLGLRPHPPPSEKGLNSRRRIRILSFHMQNNLFVFSSEYTPMGCIYIKALKSYTHCENVSFSGRKLTHCILKQLWAELVFFFFLNMWPITILQWIFHTYWFKLYIQYV